ncbi:MAG: hypothetical protein HRU81_07825 [Gammaproteobacteria bacterium]|nr:MAG: hypothetical protein HRU81_07825 [Gammaproteobacteria bacterium]
MHADAGLSALTKKHAALPWKICLIIIALQTPLVAYFLMHPVAFQWSNVITAGTVTDLGTAQHRFLDVRTALGKIPYNSTAQVFAINPPDRYQRTIIEGNGNCSNFVNGLAYQLIHDGVSFQIAHFLHIEDFLRGVGHSALNVPYEIDGQHHIGIVDVAEGGIPMMKSRNLTLADLAAGGLHDVTIEPLNSRQDRASPYYGPFLDGSILGIMDGAATARYFRFLERIYVPLGGRKLETYMYRGLAIVFALYPPVVVTAADYEKLFAGHRPVRVAARTLTALLRIDAVLAFSAPIVLLGWLLFRIIGNRTALT